MEDDDSNLQIESNDSKMIMSSPIHETNVQEVLDLFLEHSSSEKSDLSSKPESMTAPLSITAAMTLADAADEISLVEEGDLEGAETIQLEDGTTAFVQALGSDDIILEPKFVNGQAVQLEDGTTAYLHTSPGEGLQAVQLEDGTTAYISTSPPEDLFNGEASALGLDHVASSSSDPIDCLTSSPREANSWSRSIGDKSCRCTYDGCHRLYSTQHHLKVHERSHTGDRPYKCTAHGCSKTFTTSYGLKSHIRTHTGETPYKCPDKICLKAFKTSGDLQKHIRTHTGERPFKCPFEGCDRAFTTSNIRKVHIRTHTGERPYICSHKACGRAFASATNYKNHIRIHTGEKPYVCLVQGCSRRFTEYSSLYKHHVVHTHTKPYMCNMCGRHYRQNSTLAMHRRTTHGILNECATNEEGLETTLPESMVTLQEDVDDPDGNDLEPKKTKRIQTSNGQIGTVPNGLVISENPQVMLATSNFKTNDTASTIVTLQAGGETNTLQIQDGAIFSAQPHQIVLLTDASQLAAFQQFAQEARLGHFPSTSRLRDLLGAAGEVKNETKEIILTTESN